MKKSNPGFSAGQSLADKKPSTPLPGAAAGPLPWLKAAILSPILLLLCIACFSWKPTIEASPKTAPMAPAFQVGHADLRAHFEANSMAPAGSAATWAEIRSFYEHRDFAPAWLENGKPTPAADALITALGRCEDPGRPDRLDARFLERWSAWVKDGVAPVQTVALLERDLTIAYLDCAARSQGRRLNSDPERFRWDALPAPMEKATYLATAMEEAQLKEALKALVEPHPQLARLGTAIRRYERITAAGGWPRIPDGPTLEVNQPASADRIAALAERLALEGLLDRNATLDQSPDELGAVLFSDELADGVRRFQISRGLEPDGKVGPATQEALQVPASDLLGSLLLNLERGRHLPAFSDGRAVLVNLPAFRLWVMDQGQAATTMRVVVGKPSWETPVMADHIQYLVVNPAWNVPESIAADEVLPKIKEDPSYVARQGFQILDGWHGDAEALDPETVAWSEIDPKKVRFRQAPGPLNPLGRVKFIFPNEHSVYLHDTNARAGFGRARRAQSHGCVRVEDPLALADALLPLQQAERLRRHLDSGQRDTLNLETPVPVYLIYMTAWVADDGVAHFYEDIYDRDARFYSSLTGEGEDMETPAEAPAGRATA